MTVTGNENEWAEMTFGQARLGDARRTARLVKMATDLARSPKLSVDAAARGDAAAAEGAHRLVRNKAVTPQAIAEAGFGVTAELAEQTEGLLLALEDTTTLRFNHSVIEELGDVDGGQEYTKGWLVHSVLVAEADTKAPLGLIEQTRWKRAPEERGKRRRRKQRAYSEKESYKWERASRQVSSRVGEEVERRLVSVCDRESDVFEYLAYKTETPGHFVVRASWDRVVENQRQNRLWACAKTAPVVGQRKVVITQRGGPQGRPARVTAVEVSSGEVTLRAPKRQKGSELEPLDVQLVYAREITPPEDKEPMEWLLFTDLEVTTFEQAERVVDFYQARWLIEDFHKGWKTGTRVEKRRQRHAQNLEKVAVIAAFVAVRLLQIRSLAACADDICCSEVFSRTEWQVLWLGAETTPPPDDPPTIGWAWHALAKLGGWRDTQRTGRVGWLLLWRGWSRLEQRVEGFELALRFHQDAEM